MKDFKLQFYVINDGVPNMPDSFILGMLDRAEKDGTLETFFFGDQVVNRGAFLHRVKSGQCLFYIGMKDGNIVGFGLLDDIHYKKANIHFCIFKSFWGRGENISQFCKWACSEMLKTFSVLCGVTPEKNRLAVRFLKEIGFKIEGVIPKYFYNEKTASYVNGIVSYLTAEEG